MSGVLDLHPEGKRRVVPKGRSTVFRSNAVRVGRILGVEIKLDYSWFIILVLTTWSLAGQYFPGMYSYYFGPVTLLISPLLYLYC